MAGALEGAPHRQLEGQRGAALAPRDVREVLAAIHAEIPAHDPVRMQGPRRKLDRIAPGLDDVALIGEEPSELQEVVHEAFSSRYRPEWIQSTDSPPPGRRLAERTQSDAGEDARAAALVPDGDPQKSAREGYAAPSRRCPGVFRSTRRSWSAAISAVSPAHRARPESPARPRPSTAARISGRIVLKL